MEELAVIDPSADHARPSMFCIRSFSGETWNELKALLHLAWPTILSFCFLNLLSMISMYFAGHLGKTELAAASLAISFINVTAVSVGIGLLSALETLCSQAFGAKKYDLVGIVLQRGIWILGIACFPVWALWINTERLLLSMNQNAEISRLVQDFVSICIPSLPGIYLFELLQRYLQSQSLVRPVLYVGVILIVLHIGICILLVHAVGLGFRGVAAAWTITYGFSGCVLGCYMLVFKLHERTWPGWSMRSLLGWGQFVKLAVPGMFMICIEWWTFEIGVFVMGYVGEVHLGAFGILMQWAGFLFMIPLGLSVAVGVRVGNKLGAGDPKGARLSCIVAVASIGCIMGVVCVLVLTCRAYMGRVFSGNKEVILLVADVALLMGPFELCDGLQGVCSGVIRGCGRQKTGVVINFISYIVLQLPLGIFFTFYVIKGLKGYWTGVAAALSVQAFSYLTVLWRTDWTKEANMAKERTRTNRTELETSANQDPPATFARGKPCLTESVSSLLAKATSSLRRAGVSGTRREDQSRLIGVDTLVQTDPGDRQQDCNNHCDPLDRTHPQHLPTGTDSEAQQRTNDDDFLVRLSSTERRSLVLRRLLPLLAAIVILGAGLCVRFFSPRPS